MAEAVSGFRCQCQDGNYLGQYDKTKMRVNNNRMITPLSAHMELMKKRCQSCDRFNQSQATPGCTNFLCTGHANIMMMNDMDGYRKYGQVKKPRGFNYAEDLIIQDGLAAEKLVLADSAWCETACKPPYSDPGYMDTTGVVFYSTLAQTFEGIVVLSNTVTPPSPQPLQIKLEGLGSISAEFWSNEAIGSIGRWWDNNGPGGTANNISDSDYEAVKDTHDVLGYVIFDGFDTADVFKAYALDSSYHVLWIPQPGRSAEGSVVMPAGGYVAYFALTENITWWRGVFLSENPLEFTISH